MSKLEAVLEIITGARSRTSSKTSLKRLRRALKTLGLSDAEIHGTEVRLEYRDRDGNLHQGFEEAK